MTSVTYMMLSIVASYRLCRLSLGFQGESGILMTSVTYLTAGVLEPPISLIIITSGPNGVPNCLITVMSLFRLVISILGYPLLSVPGIVGRSYFLYTLKVYGRGCVIRSVFCLLWVLIGGVVYIQIFMNVAYWGRASYKDRAVRSSCFDYFMDRAERSSVYCAVVQLGLLQRQDLAERVYGGRANLAVSIVSVLYSGHSRSLCNLILWEAA